MGEAFGFASGMDEAIGDVDMSVCVNAFLLAGWHEVQIGWQRFQSFGTAGKCGCLSFARSCSPILKSLFLFEVDFLKKARSSEVVMVQVVEDRCSFSANCLQCVLCVHGTCSFPLRFLLKQNIGETDPVLLTDVDSDCRNAIRKEEELSIAMVLHAKTCAHPSRQFQRRWERIKGRERTRAALKKRH